MLCAGVSLSKFCRATFLMVLCFDCWRESHQFFTSSSFIWFWIFCYLTRYYEFQWISFTNITIEFPFQKFSRSFSNWIVFPSLFRRLLVEINISCWITCKIHPCGEIIMLDWLKDHFALISCAKIAVIKSEEREQDYGLIFYECFSFCKHASFQYFSTRQEYLTLNALIKYSSLFVGALISELILKSLNVVSP